MKLDVKGAQTAVVCLRSTEESVLVRACDALFKYADKSDANKLMLHEMGATDTLFTLTHHENSLVQRNATMVFGLLAAHRKNLSLSLCSNLSIHSSFSGCSTASSQDRLYSSHDRSSRSGT